MGTKKVVTLVITLYMYLLCGGTEQGSATDHSALLHHNAHILANQIVCYIPFIL